MLTKACTEWIDQSTDLSWFACMSACTSLRVMNYGWKIGFKYSKAPSIPSQFSVICSIGLTLPVRNSMWWPVNDRNSNPGPLAMSKLTTSKVSQLKKMSADSFPVLYLDFSSSAIDFDSQTVGDDCSSLIETTWIENRSLNHMMSPDSSRRNLIPLSPRFSDRLESRDSMICNEMGCCNDWGWKF